jgi:hypothetical protein
MFLIVKHRHFITSIHLLLLREPPVATAVLLHPCQWCLRWRLGHIGSIVSLLNPSIRRNEPWSALPASVAKYHQRPANLKYHLLEHLIPLLSIIPQGDYYALTFNRSPALPTSIAHPHDLLEHCIWFTVSVSGLNPNRLCPGWSPWCFAPAMANFDPRCQTIVLSSLGIKNASDTHWLVVEDS